MIIYNTSNSIDEELEVFFFIILLMTNNYNHQGSYLFFLIQKKHK